MTGISHILLKADENYFFVSALHISPVLPTYIIQCMCDLS